MLDHRIDAIRTSNDLFDVIDGITLVDVDVVCFINDEIELILNLQCHYVHCIL